MGSKIPLRHVWRVLRVIASVFSAGRLFGGVLDMLDRLDQ